MDCGQTGTSWPQRRMSHGLNHTLGLAHRIQRTTPVFPRRSHSQCVHVTMVITPLVIVGLVSIASVETTGKGLADHTLSVARDQDCKISRSISGNDVCRPSTPEPRATVTVSQPTAPRAVSSIQTMEDVFAQRRNQKVDQKIQK